MSRRRCSRRRGPLGPSHGSHGAPAAAGQLFFRSSGSSSHQKALWVSVPGSIGPKDPIPTEEELPPRRVTSSKVPKCRDKASKRLVFWMLRLVHRFRKWLHFLLASAPNTRRARDCILRETESQRISVKEMAGQHVILVHLMEPPHPVSCRRMLGGSIDSAALDSFFSSVQARMTARGRARCPNGL